MGYKQHVSKAVSSINLSSHLRQLEERLNNLEKKVNESLYYTNINKNSRAIKLYDDVVLTTLYTSQKMYVNGRDISVAPHLIMDGIWEPEITKVFRSVLSKKDVVFDIGANFGYFGIISGAEVTDGSIHFFEPNPALTPLISNSVSVNGLSGISRVNTVGIGSKEGALDLHLVGDYLGSSTLRNITQDGLEISGINVSSSKKISVPVITVDAYCKKQGIKQVDVIKIDVEGFEPEVYSGMKNIIKNSPDLKLFLEFTDDAYSKPELFFKKIQSDFASISCIDAGHDGKLVKISSYSGLAPFLAGGWCMLLATNPRV